LFTFKSPLRSDLKERTHFKERGNGQLMFARLGSHY
jgi:hypothetical protein